MRVVSRDIEAINVINLHEVYETGDLVYLVMDLIDGGDLLDFLDTHSSKHSLNDEDILVIMKQLTHGLKHLADSNIVHRDIKPENLLFKYKDMPISSNQIVICDMGVSTKVYTNKIKLMLMTCGTPGYIAPEILSQSKKLSDMYGNFD